MAELSEDLVLTGLGKRIEAIYVVSEFRQRQDRLTTMLVERDHLHLAVAEGEVLEHRHTDRHDEVAEKATEHGGVVAIRFELQPFGLDLIDVEIGHLAEELRLGFLAIVDGAVEPTGQFEGERDVAGEVVVARQDLRQVRGGSPTDVGVGVVEFFEVVLRRVRPRDEVVDREE